MTEDDEDKPDPFDHLPEGHPSRDRDYEVGKNRPPIAGRFPPGTSGNPNGKKKGKHVATQVREAFTAPRAVSIGGRQRKRADHLGACLPGTGSSLQRRQGRDGNSPQPGIPPWHFRRACFGRVRSAR